MFICCRSTPKYGRPLHHYIGGAVAHAFIAEQHGRAVQEGLPEAQEYLHLESAETRLVLLRLVLHFVLCLQLLVETF